MKGNLRATMRVALWSAMLTLGLITTATAQVSVTATAGTPGPTSYATLGAAFTAINAGTHQGDIIVEISANTTETGPCVLNSSDAAPAAYTSVLIRPSADGVSVSGTTANGRGVIELKGADNVTIDGDNPNTAGTNRNLSIINTASSTATYTSVVRIATAANVVSANGITVKNLILTGSATSRNASANTSTTGSENTTFGIYAGGNGGSTATDAPTAVSSVTSTTAPSGTTINSLLVNNNEISACARGIVFNGAVSSVSNGVTISGNTVGASGTLTGFAPFTTPATTVYTKGIWVNGTNAVTISANTLRNILSYVGTGMTAIELVGAIGSGTISIANNNINGIAQNVSNTNAVKAILVSSAGGAYTIAGNTVNNVQWFGGTATTAQQISAIEVNTSATSGVIEQNKVSKVYDLSTGTYGAYGINISGGNNVTVRNNFVSDVNRDMTGGFAFSTTYGVFGIRVGAGTGHIIANNTVSLTGSQFGTANSSLLTAALAVVATTSTGLVIQNNILSNTLTGGTTSVAHVSLYLPTGGTSSMNATINNNFYFTGTDVARQGVAQAGTTAGTGFYLQSDFNSAAITPAANLRAYTSSLSSAGTNDNASYASTGAAPFVSATDLHIDVNSVNAPALNGVAAVLASVTNDIDGDVRNATTPDIGADEFNLTACSGADGGTATATNANRCAGQTVALSSTGYTTGQGVSYQWKVATVAGGPYTSVSGGTGATTVSYTSAALTAGTYYYVLEVTCSNGPVVDLSNEVVVTVNSLPTVSVSPATATYCQGGNAIALTASGASTYTWSPASGLSATTGSSVNANPSSTTTYTITGTDANGCSATTSKIVTSAPGVTNAAASASPTLVCSGSATTLNATANPYTVSILTENFNSGASAWTRVNNSTGGTSPAAAAWTDRPDGYSYDGGTPYHSNDNSQFVQTNSDVQGSGGTTNTSLVSPAFSTTGLTNVTVNFYQYYRDVNDNGDTAIVEVSLDGTNWTIAQIYTANTGSETAFASASVVLPSTFDNQATVYVRFRYFATWDWYWSIDNVSITGSSSAFTYNWVSTPAGFTSTQQSPSATVSANTDFAVTISNPFGCSATASTSVTTQPGVTGATATASEAEICEGATVTLNATYNATQVTLLVEKFNGGAPAWTRTNNSTGGTPADAAWKDQADGYNYDGTAYHSNDNSQFVQTNSDDQGLGGTTETILTSPAFSSVGNANLVLHFYQFYNDLETGGDSAIVEASTDGTNWTTVAAFDDDYGAEDAFDAQNISLPVSFSNQPSVYVRFRYIAEWAWYWSIDNVSITADAGINNYSWTANPAGFTSSNQSASVTPTTTTEYTVVITNPSTGCTDTASVTVTVNAAPPVAVSPQTANYCNPGTGVALTASGADTYVWSPASSLSAATGSSVNASPDATTVYTVTGTDVNGCSATASATITSSPSVTNATAGASASAICPGGAVNLTSSADPVPTVLVSENFNSSSNGWNIFNNSTGGTNVAGAAWTYQPDGFDYDGTPYHSNDNSQFVQANSDIQGSGGTTNTSIMSPAFSTTGYSQIAVKFYQYYRDIDDNGDSAVVEASLDGANWVIAGVYESTVGAEDAFAQSTVTLPATFNNQPSVYVRFRYKATWDWYWSVDNVTITGSSPNFTYSWSSNPAGFTSTDQNPAGLTPAVTTDYTVTITAPGGCTATATTTVTVNSILPVAVNPSPASYCAGGVPVALTASGATTYEWSPATDLSATTGATVSASPSATTIYSVTGTDNNGCTGTTTVTVNVTNGSTGATATANPTAVCAGGSVSLSASGTNAQQVLLTENFNSGASTWTRENLSTGGTVANAAWTDRADGYSYAGGTAYHSNDNTQFVQTNSDAQGSGGATRTRLVSPSFSTVGRASLSVNFFHYYRDINDAGDSAMVEATSDGVNWTTVAAYTASVGSENAFASATVNLPATFENKPNVRIRFQYRATYDWYWSIDNVTVNSAATFYTYSWSSDPAGFTANTANATATPTATTTYTVSVTDPLQGCISTATVTVNVNQLPVVTATAAGPAYCGSPVALTAGGASTYAWSPSSSLDAATGTTVNASPVVATVYTVTGTDANGCTGTATVNLNSPGAVTNATASASVTTICEGESVDLSSSASSPTTLLSENFNSGATSWTRVNNSTGGNTANAAWIYQPDGYTYGSNVYHSNDNTTFAMSNSDNQGSGGTTNASLISPAFSTTGITSLQLKYYQYYRDIDDDGDSAVIEASLNGTDWQIVQVYSATVGTYNGFVFANVSLPATFENQPSVQVRFRYKATWDWYWAIDNVTLTGNSSNGLAYDWSSNPSGFTSTDQNPTGVSPTETTEYTVVISNAGGCSSTASVIVNVNPAPQVVANTTSTSICAGEEVTLTGSGATSYSWSGGVTDGVAFAPNATDTYTVTGTDANGCSASASVSVAVNSIPVVIATASSSSVCAGSQVTLTGGGATSYSWSGGVTDGVAFTPNATDTYTVTGTDNGCTATASVTVSVNSLPTVTASTTANAVCAGGQVTLTGGGATSYSWSGGATDGVAFAPNTTDTYTVTGTDGNGCSATASVSVTVNQLPTVTANTTATAVCAGGQVTLTGGGATSYSWSGSVTDGVAFAPNTTDTYTVTGTDGNGCSATASVSVAVNTIPTVTASASSASVCSGNQVTLTGGGATSYSWSGGVTDGVAFTPNATATYTVTGTDNGCSATASVSVAVNQTPAVTATSSSAAVCAGGQVTLTGGGATSYSWSGGVTDGVAFTPNATATYTVTGTDNGCSATATVSVAVNQAPAVTATASSSSVCAGSQVTLTGGGATSYSWSGGATDGVAFTPNATATYTVTGTDNGCSATATVSVTVNSVPTVTATASSASVCAGGQVTLTGGGATSYSWSGGVTDGVAFTPNATATYTVTGTDNGCSATATVSVAVNTAPTVTLSLPVDTIQLNGGNVTLSGGSPLGGTYTGTGVTGTTFNPITSGLGTFTITYTYTDGSGCAGTATDVVHVVNTVGVQQVSALTGVQIYPNPNQGQFVISLAAPADKGVQVEITDATGKLVDMFTMIDKVQQVNIDTYAAGVYFVKLISGELHTTQRIIKQ